ncbi:CD1375 family protein [Jeotgalibaca porci]
MAKIYANLIEAGLRNIDDVNVAWRDDTIEELKRRGSWKEVE